jgi:hypothetical protein
LGDLTAVGLVVHQKKFKVLLVADKQFLETIWQQVSGFVVLLATNLWHFLCALHSSSGEAIDTADLSVRIRVDSLELMGMAV